MRLCNELSDFPAFCDEQAAILKLLHAFDTYEAFSKDCLECPARSALHQAIAFEMPRQRGKTYVQALFLTACAISAPGKVAACFLVGSKREAQRALDWVYSFLDRAIEEGSSSDITDIQWRDGEPKLTFTHRDGRKKSISCVRIDEPQRKWDMWLCDVYAQRPSDDGKVWCGSVCVNV